MNCPKCGSENPDGAQICTSCSCALGSTLPKHATPKKKASKLTILSALLSGLSGTLLCFVNPTLAFLVACTALFTAAGSIRKIRKSKGTLVGKSFAIVVLIVTFLQMTLMSYWGIDAPPVPDDYTIADVRSAPPEYNRTQELLNSLANEDGNSLDAPAIGLRAADLEKLKAINKLFRETDCQEISSAITADTQRILQIWHNAKKGRDIISKLGTFPEIADLTQPSLDPNIPWLGNIRPLAHLQQAYACLQACQANDQSAVRELIRFDSVFRKLSLNARSMITKLVCIACLATDIQAANFVINSPQTSQNALTLLAEHFSPPSAQYTSLRNAFIFDYLSCKSQLREMTRQHQLKYSALSPLKVNSTLRVLRNSLEKRIAAEDSARQPKELCVWPTLYPKLPVITDPNGKLPRYYTVYNPVGSMLLQISIPAFGRVSEIRTKLQVHYDLLQIVLDKRLGQEVSLKASAYSDEYIIDVERKIIFSPGPDGKPHTKDDIKLPINPKVLNLHQTEPRP